MGIMRNRRQPGEGRSVMVRFRQDSFDDLSLIYKHEVAQNARPTSYTTCAEKAVRALANFYRKQQPPTATATP